MSRRLGMLAAVATAAVTAAIAVPSALASTVLTDQNNNYGGTQIISDGSIGRQAADDFTVPSGVKWTISEVDVSGEICSTSGSVTVQLYSDASGLPGTLLQSAVVTTADGLVQGGPDGCDFTIPVGFTALDPGHYWLSVIASDMWYWSAQYDYPLNGNLPAFVSPRELGDSAWHPITDLISWWDYDLMFALQGTSAALDATAPTISITTPADGATYYLNQPVLASYSCSDSGSGVATCDGPVASGSAIDTSTTGSHTFTVDSADNAGNTSSSAVTYTVLSAGDLIGALQAKLAGMGLQKGTVTSLTSLLNQAAAALAAGDEASALQDMSAFLKVVAAQQKAGKLTSAQASELVAAANQIITVINY